jgi:hypothetical protein
MSLKPLNIPQSTYHPLRYMSESASVAEADYLPPAAKTRSKGLATRFFHRWARAVGFQDDHNVILWL